jgi:RNA polymerase sigma factor (sigma-70 family)
VTTETTAAGDEAVEPADFRTFFERSCPSMLARALLIAGHRQDAEDAVQQAYVEALRRWERLGRYDSPDAWVYKIVKQRLWGAARRRTWLRPVGLEVSRPPTASPEQTAHARAVLATLATLPRRQRQVIVLHCLHGMTQQDIADELGITRSAVAGSVLKARRNLEKVLGMTSDEHPGGDPLIPAARRTSLPAGVSAADQLATSLRETEAWLRAGIEADAATLQRIRSQVMASAAKDEPT